MLVRLRKNCKDLARDGRCHRGSPFLCFTDVAENFFWRRFFQKVTGSTFANCLEHMFVVVKYSQHQNSYRKTSATNVAQSFQAVCYWHVDVHENNIRLKVAD